MTEIFRFLHAQIIWDKDVIWVNSSVEGCKLRIQGLNESRVLISCQKNELEQVMIDIKILPCSTDPTRPYLMGFSPQELFNLNLLFTQIEMDGYLILDIDRDIRKRFQSFCQHVLEIENKKKKEDKRVE